MKNHFLISGESDAARTGVLKTNHGRVKTPFFMPVATKGSVKLVSMGELGAMGIECFISNSYVFSLRPGLKTIQKAGGIHSFVGWDKSIFTDSGGFQISRPEFFVSINDQELVFRNPFDNAKDSLTPEKAMHIQSVLGSDVAMCLDDMPIFGSGLERLKESCDRTFEWAKRCIASHDHKKQLLFGICQGGTNEHLRKRSAEQIGSLDFDGFALGGLAIGESMKQTEKMVLAATPFLPVEAPRYLMGAGTPQELVKAVTLGIDCFDSAFPTHTGRHGLAFTSKGRINLLNTAHRFDLSPLDPDCGCIVCESHSRAYLHHLFRTKEENGMKYLSYHNLFFLNSLMGRMREEIERDRLDSFAKKIKF